MLEELCRLPRSEAWPKRASRDARLRLRFAWPRSKGASKGLRSSGPAATPAAVRARSATSHVPLRTSLGFAAASEASAASRRRCSAAGGFLLKPSAALRFAPLPSLPKAQLQSLNLRCAAVVAEIVPSTAFCRAREREKRERERERERRPLSPAERKKEERERERVFSLQASP